MIYDKNKAFVSYSHKDESFREEFENHLSTLKRQGLINVWNDRKIFAGEEIDNTINANLSSSSLVILLISSDFIASDYCYCKEFEYALDRQKRGEARVISIVLRPTDLTATPFMKLKLLPKDGKPISTWENRDAAWVDVVNGIRDIFINNADSSNVRKEGGAENREDFLKIKSNSDFKIFYRDWFSSPFPDEFNNKINQIVNDRYAPLSVFSKSVEARLEFLILPILKQRIEIETNLRLQYKLPYTDAAMNELKNEIKAIILERWPSIINGARIDAENNTLKQHGSLPEYKLDEIRRMNEDYKTIFPSGIFDIAIEWINSDYAKTMLSC